MNTKARAATPARAAAPAADPGPGISAGVAALVYFGLALLYFFPAFLPDRHIYGTDYLVGGYFFHEFISEQLAKGELPRWVPYVYGGLPLYANPGSTYHPVRFLADWVFPVSKIWPTFFVVHFGLAGLGTYLLGRELGARRWVAFVGGLAFQFTGLTMSWVLAGHEGRIIVATLTPLVFFFFHRGIRTGAFAPFAGAAAAIGSALLTFQIQSSYYMLVGALVWSVFCLWHFGLFREPRRLAKPVALGVGAVAFGFAMASVNFLPFQDYVAESPRGMAGGRGYEYSTSYSMPTPEVAAVAVPELSGYLETYRGTNPFKLHVEYVGAFVIALAALGAYFSRRNRYWWFFVGLGLFALTISLGGNTPLYRLYYELLPGTKRFRAPSISFFLVSLSLVMMATLALEALAARLDERRASARALREPEPLPGAGTAGLILGGVVAVGVLLGMLASGAAAPGAPPVGAAAFRFAFFAAAVAAVVWYWMRGALNATATLALLSVLTVVDLWIVDRKFFETVPPPDEMFAADDVANFLRSQPGRDRSWVLPIPAGAVYRGNAGNYLMHFDLDQAGGEHGNQLQRWNQLLGAGRETYVDWHNFFADPQVVDTPEGQAVTFRSAPGVMEAANIRYIVSGVPLARPGLREVHRGSALVYENTAALPRAYLVPSVVTVADEDGALAAMERGFDPRTTAFVSSARPVELPSAPLQGGAEVAEYTPDRVVVQTRASREALLVLADNYYEGWRAEVDGREAPVLRTNHALRGVVVPAGEHRVTFTFHSPDLRTGLYLYLATLALLAGYALFLLARHFAGRRAARPAPAAG
ncbi:MAG TPA: YfhO family protein [Longimicrobiaceae bacterium]|nr:YfhO family protein [Longimicrobiaceae bacterium]